MQRALVTKVLMEQNSLLVMEPRDIGFAYAALKGIEVI